MPSSIDSKTAQGKNASELSQRFKEVINNDSPRRTRIIRNTVATMGIEGSSYTQEQRAYMLREGISPQDFTFLAKYTKGLAGSIINTWYQPRFVALEGSNISPDMMAAVNSVYSSDKDLNSYKKTAMQTIYNGLVCIGIEEITVKREYISKPRTWTIGFEPLRPESIVFVTTDKAGRVSDNATEAYKYTYPTLQELEKIYPDKKNEIKILSMQKESINNEKTSSVYDSSLDPYENIRNKKYQVVEYYHMENEKTTKNIYVPTWEEVPETLAEGPFADMVGELALQAWAAEKGIVLEKGDIVKIDEITPVLYVDVFVPDLDLILDTGKDERQIGRLPFFAWSYMENNEIPIGVVDVIWATAQDMLKRETAKTKYITQVPLAKPWVHPDIVGGDTTKLAKVIQEWNDPSKPIVVDSEVTPGIVERMMGIERGVEIPQAILRDESFKLALMDSLSGLTPSMQGSTERSGESGIMFQRKVLESTNQQRLPMLMLAEHEKQKASAWLKLSQKVYGGRVNVNREVALPEDRGILRINEFVGYDTEGKEIILNDFSDLSRVDVVIGKAPETDFYRQATRANDLEALKTIRPSQTNSEVIAALENNLVLQMDYANDKERAAIEAAVARRAELERLKAEAEINKLEASIKQTDNAIDMMDVDAAITPIRAKQRLEETKAKTRSAQAQAMQGAAQVQQLAQQMQQSQMIGGGGAPAMGPGQGQGIGRQVMAAVGGNPPAPGVPGPMAPGAVRAGMRPMGSRPRPMMQGQIRPNQGGNPQV